MTVVLVVIGAGCPPMIVLIRRAAIACLGRRSVPCAGRKCAKVVRCVIECSMHLIVICRVS